MSAFHAYDIRAVYGDGIDETLAFRAGRAFVRYSGATRILGGYDARTHSEALYRAFAAGAQSRGATVTGVGMVSTPALHYLQMSNGFPAAYMATASHNPPRYHGFKLYDDSGGSVSYQKGLAEIEALVAGDDSPAPAELAEPTRLEASALDDYVEFAARPVTADPLHEAIAGTSVVVDASNGSAGAVVRAAAARMRLDAVMLNEAPDGSFPAHVPNPLEPESHAATIREVRRTGAALGAILDGDGDRVIFVDERGEVVSSSFAGALIAQELLDSDSGSAVAYDLISSRAFPEAIEAAGGVAVKSRVGYTHLYDQMVATEAIYGNEASGHVYFRVQPGFFTESAIYALAVLVRLLARSGKPLSQLVAPLRERYFQQGEHNIKLSADAVVGDVLDRVRTAFAEGNIEELDGVSVSFDRYWFNVRPSNTEPLLRLRLEAVDEAAAQEGTARVLAAIEGKP